ncbi:glycosyltransferase family 4 protein [Alkalicoccobacillus porphyridii]|uniref:Glycosyltransferase family 4 protein n=1 Tax=Alkalicoccobacillus porphyridii TaxID=2597270 RepID=A0A554A4H0_9BACI|nr:glycosyltransferase family 4 protein [Alkalicoccobacillus porphyridii]TSB48571.1 glycosyltransferase family 4 protein [Alkalicoccobacillus porphyridii]
MKKRVLFLVNHDVVIYNFRKEIVEKLIAEGFEVIISSPGGERIEDLKAMGCEYEEIIFDRHGTNVFNELKLIKYYKQLIKRVKADVVLTFTIKPNIYGGIACKTLGIPYIANITGLGTAVENGGLMQKITTALYKNAFKKINTVFFQNQENMDFFKRRNIAVSKHKLLPGSGVNLEQFNLLDYPSDDKIEFVFISRIMKQKGIEQYLEAAEFIKGKYPNTRFHICGFCEEAYEDKLYKYHNEGIIHYHGMIRNINNILERTHCTIHPTYYPEGLSNVLLESAAVGRPIITTDRSGCREVVDDGINGYIVKANNSEDLILKIEGFLKLEFLVKKQMGLAGRKKVEKSFDRNTVIKAYMEEINKC